MLRGLAIRRLFIALELFLFLAMLGGVGLIAGERLGLVRLASGGQVSGALEVPPNSEVALAVAKARPDYDGLVSGGLFGSAATTLQAAAPPPPPPEPETITDLQLKLCGTSATSPKDPLATAIIVNQENNANAMHTYFLGQSVVEDVTLDEVYPRKVYLMNKKKNRREVLLAEDNAEAGAGAGTPAGKMASSAPNKPGAPTPPKPTAPPPAPGAAANNRVTVKKAEVIQDLIANSTDYMTKIKPELYKDASGNVAGITASNITQFPIAQKLGIQEGDVLQTVNNETVDSQEKIMEMVQRYRNASMVRIGLLRNGQPMVLMYRLE